MSSPSQRRSSKPMRLSPFFRDLASPISPHHRSGGRLAVSPSKAAAVSALWKESLAAGDDPPPPPVFTLDDRADFSPEPGLGDPPLPSPDSRPGSGRRTATPRLQRKSSLSPSPSFSSSPFALRNGPEASGSVVGNGKDPESSSLTSPRSSGGERGKGSASPVEGLVKPWALGTLPRPSEVARPEALRDAAAQGDGDEEKKWVTVFGFTPGDTNLVLREFEKCGPIVKHVPGPKDANWIHIFFQSTYDARKALEKNSTQLNSVLIVGVKYADRIHLQHLRKTLERTNHGEFMVALPWKSANSNTAADPQKCQAAIPNGVRQSTSAVATPSNSLFSRVFDLMFGI